MSIFYLTSFPIGQMFILNTHTLFKNSEPNLNIIERHNVKNNTSFKPKLKKLLV